MFTSVSTFQTSSFLSVMSSWIWYLTSICFVVAWYTRFPNEVYCALRVTIYDQHWMIDLAVDQKIDRQSMELDGFLCCFWCGYVLSLCCWECRTFMQLWPRTWDCTASIDEDIWCGFPIVGVVRVVGVIEICEAFDFTYLIQKSNVDLQCRAGTEKCSSQLPNAYVWVLTCNGWWLLCRKKGLAGSPPSRTWDFLWPTRRVFDSWAISPPLWMESLFLIIERMSEAVLVLASHSSCWSASTPFGYSLIGSVGGSSSSDFSQFGCPIYVGLLRVTSLRISHEGSVSALLFQFYHYNDKHVVNVKDQVDPGLIGQLPGIHAWVGVGPVVSKQLDVGVELLVPHPWRLF